MRPETLAHWWNEAAQAGSTKVTNCGSLLRQSLFLATDGARADALQCVSPACSELGLACRRGSHCRARPSSSQGEGCRRRSTTTERRGQGLLVATGQANWRSTHGPVASLVLDQPARAHAGERANLEVRIAEVAKAPEARLLEKEGRAGHGKADRRLGLRLRLLDGRLLGFRAVAKREVERTSAPRQVRHESAPTRTRKRNGPCRS